MLVTVDLFKVAWRFQKLKNWKLEKLLLKIKNRPILKPPEKVFQYCKLVIFGHYCKNIISALLFWNSHFGARDQLDNDEFAFVRICMQGVYKYYNFRMLLFKTVEFKLDWDMHPPVKRFSCFGWNVTEISLNWVGLVIIFAKIP